LDIFDARVELSIDEKNFRENIRMRLNIVKQSVATEICMFLLRLRFQLLFKFPLARVNSICEEIEVTSGSFNIFFDLDPDGLINEVLAP